MARLVFRSGPYAGKAVQLPGSRAVAIGRNRDLDLMLPDVKLSRKHCQLEPNANGYVIRDLASTNGTYVNGRRIEGEVQLRHLDVLVAGTTEMEFQAPELLNRALEGVPAEARAGSAEGQGLDELWGAVIEELGKPLPPEPQALPAPTAPPKQVYFCDECNGSIPALDVDLDEAKTISGKLYCKECLAKGIVVPPPPTEAPRAGAPVREGAEPLAGVDPLEEIALRGPKAARGGPGAPAAASSGDATGRLPPLPPAPEQPPAEQAERGSAAKPGGQG